jgi:transposase
MSSAGIFRSKHKNDRNDAERLAKLLYLGEAPVVHVPSLEVRTWRELINCRSQVIAKRTRARNTVRALLRSAGVTSPKSPGLWSKKGLAWLRQLDLPTASQQLRRDLLVEEIDGLIRQVRRVEQRLNRRAAQTGAVARLRSIPGVGIRTVEALAAFIDDPLRFGDAKAVGCYFGLVPCQDQSGDRTGSGTSPARAHRSCASWSPKPPGSAAPVADGARVLRARSARRPAAQEDRAGPHRPLLGAGDVGHAEARDRLAREPRAGQGVRRGRMRRSRA